MQQNKDPKKQSPVIESKTDDKIIQQYEEQISGLNIQLYEFSNEVSNNQQQINLLNIQLDEYKSDINNY